ncbi:MAG: flavodoxin-dependent (E)-4-hydroxy-3-methylbut-2-enyl-diphosphate synthase [Firmicutes bacterium]|nr:flavodoxin-dependent (E)-4-hydroxy-3-methylbut-2-enyl-diphosphate synthase [Bacillota bacterium]
MKRVVYVKNVPIGGEHRISIQSMTNTDTLDIEATLSQIKALDEAGCDIVRIAVSNEAEVKACESIIKNTKIPLVADIQFNYRLAVRCADINFSAIRFNPGNIGNAERVREVATACKRNKVPIRIGVNSGSLEKDIVKKYGHSAEGLVESALSHARVLEKENFFDIVLSLKSSCVKTMIEANRIADKLCDYPLHIGVTESGVYEDGLYKSAIGIGSLLLDGIGSTIRVSLTGDPVEEIAVAKNILKACGKLDNFCEIVSCPTCSRCKIDLVPIVEKVKGLTKNINKKLKIAVMGCVVNGPGEAKNADLGVAGASDKFAVFEKGKIIFTGEQAKALEIFEKLIAGAVIDCPHNIKK